VPIEQQPPQLDYVSLNEEPVKLSTDTLTNEYALEVVNQTYWAYELFRTQNHDRRWSLQDSLYYGYTPPRVWNGTNVARAAFTYPIVFDQIEAALPVIMNALFGVGPDWFQVESEPGTDPREAQQLHDTLSYALEHPKDELGSTCLTEFKLAIKSLLLYGNGGVSVEWDVVRNRPVVEWVDIRDFYMDPGLSVPSIDESRSVIRRKFMTIDELRQLGKKDSRMSIPNNDILWYMAKNVPQAPAEQTKRIQEALRNIYFSPGFSDYLPMPSDHKVEVLIYYTKDRIIWVLNKQWIAYNGPNPYGFIPFAFAPCYIVPGRFYAQSVGDVQENNQRYIEALMNGHLDEQTLRLHPPRIQKRSSLITPNQQRWGPGQVFTGENKDDVTLLQPNNPTTDVFSDIQWLSMAAEKRTGINSMGQGGVPTPSNANRTLGGMQMQAGGSSSRLSEIVSNVELYLLVPVLYKLYKLMQFHTRPGQALPATNSQGQYYFVDAGLSQKKIRFRMLAASKMVTRDKLMQIVPMWMQILSQGTLVESLMKTGQTIDFDELFRMLQDATGVAHLYQLVRAMRPDEKQQMQQEQQQAQQAQLAGKQLDGQTRMNLMQTKVQGDLQKTLLEKQPSYWEQQMQQIAQIMLAAKKQEAQMNLQKKQADVQVDVQKSVSQREQAQLDHQMKMAQLMQSLQADQASAQNQQSISDNYPATRAPQSSQAVNPNQKRPTTGQQGRHKAEPPK
jgi:hypothetical protein